MLRAVQNAWSEAVFSGTQDLNVAGLTPMTLTAAPPAVISAPSKVIMLRTPAIFLSLAICAGRQTLGGDDQQVGQDDLAERAGLRGGPGLAPGPAPATGTWPAWSAGAGLPARGADGHGRRTADRTAPAANLVAGAGLPGLQARR